ncbi:MAG: DNA-directed RNA polymerase [Methanosphaera sp. rholeuAM74]|nr:MAG: DNA-directed RNA polymerase [Methanosphaera sp. rholeuAM74]
MYEIVTIEDTVRIPPNKFDQPLEETAVEMLNKKYVGKVDKKMGILITVTEILEHDTGRVVIGDGSAFYHVTFNSLFFKPVLHEVVDGEVIEIIEFGAFVRIGPLDGLVHVSQITDDFISYDEKGGKLQAKESTKTLDASDYVRSRIVAVSMKGNTTNDCKIGLTMRQPNLGRFEWIQAEKSKKKT